MYVYSGLLRRLFITYFVTTMIVAYGVTVVLSLGCFEKFYKEFIYKDNIQNVNYISGLEWYKFIYAQFSQLDD